LLRVLDVRNLAVTVGNRDVVKGASLCVSSGEIVLLFGPNASGKTSLAMAILGHPKYRISGGRIFFYGKDITDLSIEARVRLGLTATFQFVPEVDGITLREIAEAIAERHMVHGDFVEEMIEILKLEELMDRHINVGFSGGERKRVEIFLTSLQLPKFVIFDEPDSGVDPDSISMIGRAIMRMMDYGLKGALIITHTGFLAKHISASRAYVMMDGRIICHGPADAIADHILSYGFKMCEKKFRGDIDVLEGENKRVC